MDGTDMRRVVVIMASGLALAGCASGPGAPDWWPKFEPAPVSIAFESAPAGAEAKTSTGQVCQTPCTLAMPPDKEFAVTFSLAGYQPQTVPVQIAIPEGGLEASLQPNPVAVELAVAPKTPAKRKPAARTASAPKPPKPRAAAPKPTSSAQPAPSAVMPSSTDPWPPVR
jgi:hypothetical protein